MEELKENDWLHEAIKPIVKSLRYRNWKLTIRNISTDCGNYLGTLLEVNIVDGSSESEINLFVKKRVNLAKIRLVSIDDIYDREVFFYTDVSKIFSDLQNKANVPESERYNVAKVYPGTNSDIIFLENLNKVGYKTYYRMDTISYKYAKLTMKQLAKLHGLSFVLEHELPEYYESKIKSMETPYNLDKDFQAWIRNICIGTANYFEEDIKQKILDFIPTYLTKYPNYLYTSALKKSTCCLTHGDVKINNILAKELDGEPVSVIAVDYQLISYGNPVRDLHFFMYTSTNKEFRKQYLAQLKDDYYDSLTTFLKYFNLEVENIYPREEFDRTYNDYLEYGFMIALQSAMFNFTPDEAGFNDDVLNLSLAELPFNPDKKFIAMIQGVIDELIETGHL